VWIILAGIIALVYYQKKNGAVVSSVPQAVQDVASDPQIQQQIAASEQQADQEVAFDIQSQQAIFKAAGTTALAGIGGLSIAASQSVTGTLLFSATSWTIVGGIVAGIFAIVSALRSNTHEYANVLVQKYENPYSAKIIAAYQQLQAAVTSSGMTSADATSLTNAVIYSWAQYQDAMNQFIAKGGDWRTVATQSLENLDSAKGEGGTFNLNPALPKTALGNGWMTAVIQQMTAWTNQLAGAGL
jgi:hypothetical protein